MGSKRKYCKEIVPIIQKYINENNIKYFIDIFCGGANLLDKIKCENLYGNDLSFSLIALHQQAQSDFSVIPEHGSREWWDEAYSEWKKIKANPDYVSSMSLWKIGAIEWYNSFSNGGFPRGYAKPSYGRDYYNEAYRNHKEQAANANYQKINFSCGDYRDFCNWNNGDYHGNTVIYCDSPYKGTKPYAIDSKFDFDAYYNWLKETSKYVAIFVSEQALPPEFDKYIIWSKDGVCRTCGLDNNYKACEKLYLIKNFKG